MEIKPKSNRGGKRIGAGRPRKEIAGKREIAEIKLLARLDDFWELACDAYSALLAERNPMIVRDYFDRKCGKPAQAITGADGEPFQVVFQQAIIHAETEYHASADDLPICISGNDGQGA